MFRLSLEGLIESMSGRIIIILCFTGTTVPIETMLKTPETYIIQTASVNLILSKIL
jgi:hypothetical protein